MTVTRAERAAADLHAMIARAVGAGPLAGVEALVTVEGGRRLLVTVERLPPGAVEHTEVGLSASAEGARLTDLLHALARRACDRFGVTPPTLLRIRPAALAAAVSLLPTGPSPNRPNLHRRAS